MTRLLLAAALCGLFLLPGRFLLAKGHEALDQARVIVFRDEIGRIEPLNDRKRRKRPQLDEIRATEKRARKLLRKAEVPEQRVAAQMIVNRSLAQEKLLLSFPNQGLVGIIGGFEAHDGQMPYVVAIILTGYGTLQQGLRCGGTLIDPNWVLTAAHCLPNGTPTTVAEVRIGSINLSAAQSYGIKNIIPNLSYNKNDNTNDVELIELEQTVPHAATVQLATGILEQGFLGSASDATVAGWGVDESGSPTEILRYVPVPLVPSSSCGASSSYGSLLKPGMICAGKAGADSCQGDSGGPLIFSDAQNHPYQIGIASWGLDRCAQANYPGIYTSVVSQLGWICTNSGLPDVCALTRQ